MPTVPHLDLAVIGGGPAETAAAITAARAGAKVALFESRTFPRHKVCGEFISAEALEVLASLLQDEPRATTVVAEAPVVDSTRLFFGHRMIEVKVSPPGISVTRHALDALLWEAAKRAQVEVHCNCGVTSCNGVAPYLVQSTSGRYLAKAAIIAAGRWSQFAADRTIPAGPRWIGLKAHFREANPPRSSDLYFFEQGYCGVQPVAGDVVNACAMVRADCATSLQQVFTLHQSLAARAARWPALPQQVTTSPLIYREARPVHNNLIFVGDAAAFIDPFVGDGISIALQSGRLAAECLGKFLSGERSSVDAITAYQEAYAAQFAPLITMAARVRSLFSLPAIAKPPVFELLRLPGLIPYVIRKTRRAR
jgi:menaquinone-9 beta-reductase